jgi:hypothetical protein
MKGTVTLIFAVVVGVIVAGAVLWSEIETNGGEAAVSYSCGFLEGQRQMAKILGDDKPNPLPPPSADCETQRIRALRWGFDPPGEDVKL